MTLMPYCVDDLGESLVQLQLSCFHLHELLFQLVSVLPQGENVRGPRRTMQLEASFSEFIYADGVIAIHIQA